MLVLYRGRRAPEKLGPFFQALWDGGLKLAQSVRTVHQCRRDARDDITLMTSWLEMRPLCGEPKPARDLEGNLTPRIGLFRAPLWTQEQFFLGKVEEQESRHLQFGGSNYRLEPNIKEGPGGLRDIQTLYWILKRHEDIESPSDFCEPQELELLHEGQRFLWKVRFALHEASGQAEERLLFNYQCPIAEQLGYRGATVNDTVEAFMQDFYRTTSEIDRLAEVLSQQYRESLQPPSRSAPRRLNAYFQVQDGYPGNPGREGFSSGTRKGCWSCSCSCSSTPTSRACGRAPSGRSAPTCTASTPPSAPGWLPRACSWRSCASPSTSPGNCAA